MADRAPSYAFGHGLCAISLQAIQSNEGNEILERKIYDDFYGLLFQEFSNYSDYHSPASNLQNYAFSKSQSDY